MSVTRARPFARWAVAVLSAVAVMAGNSVEAAFNYARYQETSLDDVLAMPRPAKGVDIKSGAPFKLEVTLVNAGGPCATGFLKKSMAMSGFDQVGAIGVSNCITVRSAKGRDLKVFVQDVVYGFLPREVKVGGRLTLYAVHVYTAAEGPGLLVNEFQTAQPAAPAASQPSETAMSSCGCWSLRDHPGIDVDAGKEGAPVGVMEDGVVVKVEAADQAPADLPVIGGCGRYLVLKHSYPNGAVLYTRYVHLGRLADAKGEMPAVGARYKRGDKIAEVGPSRILHVELRPVALGNTTADAAWLKQYDGIADMEWSRYEPVDPRKFDPDAFGGLGKRGK
ncbi:M23 family metallopeptidase [Bradyrhizobium sp. ORS 375]|uniref:M23 family metallopeptidase n=1 Tax=Bradyrhizobium sp. (strain ORS 375) TaxID=566679 RepID=UPI001111EB2C|nr:M23 family metallopeptidase [Bradyrhizobium sp. ORS 375]